MAIKTAKKKQRRGATRKVEKPQRRGLPIRFRLPGGTLLKLASGCALLALAWFGTAWLQAQIQRPITEVLVNGDLRQIDAARVQQLLRSQLAQPGGIEPDLERARSLLLESPWVAAVGMRRHWPDRLTVQISERVPVARWRETGLLTGDAEVFMPKGNLAALALPLLAGPEYSAKELWGQYQWLSARLKVDGVGVSSLHKEERGAWRMQIYPLAGDTNIEVRVFLGREQMTEKVERLCKLLRKGLASQLAEIERVDLRYSNGASLLWKA